MQQSEIGLLSAWAQLSSQAITLPDVFDNSMFNTDRDLIKEKFAVVYDDVKTQTERMGEHAIAAKWTWYLKDDNELIAMFTLSEARYAEVERLSQLKHPASPPANGPPSHKRPRTDAERGAGMSEDTVLRAEWTAAIADMGSNVAQLQGKLNKIFQRIWDRSSSGSIQAGKVGMKREGKMISLMRDGKRVAMREDDDGDFYIEAHS